MKVLVTGAGGFLGAAVVERLLAHGHKDIRCFVRSATKAKEGALAEAFARYPDANAEYVIGDITRREDVAEAAAGVDVIYHLAAAMSGTVADMFMNTVVGTKNLLESMVADTSAKLVLVSSLSVYGLAAMPKGHVIDEQTPMEPHPERRDPYSYAKLRQEQLCWEYREKHKFPMVVLRPGVIYGPNGNALPANMGLKMFGVFLHLGRNNPVPLTYVDNCAEAVVLAGQENNNDGEIYNVFDNNLPTSKEYLKMYRRQVEKLKYVSVPFFGILGLSKVVTRYHHFSNGQLPAVFTTYKSKNLWKTFGFSNHKLSSIGWQQLVPTDEGIQRTFKTLRAAN